MGRLPVVYSHPGVCGIQTSPPVPRQGKAHFENKQVEARLPRVLCYPAAAGWECCWPLPGGSAGAAALRLHWGSLPLNPSCHFQSSSKAIIACNAFGVGIPPVFPLDFSSFRQLHLPGVSVGAGADGACFQLCDIGHQQVTQFSCFSQSRKGVLTEREKEGGMQKEGSS